MMNKVSMAKALGGGYNRFFHCRDFYRVVKGSRGSKKSKTAALCYIHDILKYPWANLLVVRRYSNTNRQSTYTDLRWAAQKLKVAHLFRFNGSLPEVTVAHTGQKILFRGLDDPLKITSIAVDRGVLSWLWIEEAYQIESAEKIDTVIESIRGSHDSPDFYKQVTMTFNPWHERHWLKREFFDEDTKRRGVWHDTTTFRDNEFLDEQDKQRYFDLYRTNPRRARIVCDGEWGVSEGLVFDRVTVRPIAPDEIDMQRMKLLLGLDFGFTHDPTALSVAWLDSDKGKLYIVDEHYETGMGTRDIAHMLKAKGYQKATIIADNAEGRLIHELRYEHGIRGIRPSQKGAGSVNAGIAKLQDLDIICSDSCTYTQDELYTYSYKKDRLTGTYTNAPEDANNHLMDALRYSLQCTGQEVKAKLYKHSL